MSFGWFWYEPYFARLYQIVAQQLQAPFVRSLLACISTSRQPLCFSSVCQSVLFDLGMEVTDFEVIIERCILIPIILLILQLLLVFLCLISDLALLFFTVSSWMYLTLSSVDVFLLPFIGLTWCHFTVQSDLKCSVIALHQYSARIKSMSHHAWLGGYRVPICEEKIKGIIYSVIPKTNGSESLRKFKLAIPRKVSSLQFYISALSQAKF